MKHILIASTLIVAAVVAGPKPEEPADPVQAAQLVVHRQLVAKLAPNHRPFSRAAPRSPSASFRPSMIVKGEERLPFSITGHGGRGTKPLEGYVRLSDKVIFIRDAGTEKYHLASKDPRFVEAEDLVVSRSGEK